MQERIFRSIAYGLVFMFTARWFFRYYKGKLNYVGEQEERRKRRVEKFGLLLIVCVIVLLICGVILLLGGFIGIKNYYLR
jgi:Na+/H+ antiporter NhaD/arsenite permease-like protein